MDPYDIFIEKCKRIIQEQKEIEDGNAYVKKLLENKGVE